MVCGSPALAQDLGAGLERAQLEPVDLDGSLDAATVEEELATSADARPITSPIASELDLRGGALLTPSAFGAEPAGVGFPLTPRLRLVPFLRFASYYNSNIFRSEDAEASAELLASAGLDLVRLGERTELRLGYGATLSAYPEFPEFQRLQHRGRFLASYTGRRVRAAAQAGLGLLGRSDDPRAFGAPIDRLLGDAAARVDVLFGRYAEVGLEGTVTYQDFLERELDGSDRISYGGSARVGSSLSLPILLEVGVRFRQISHVDDEAATDPDLFVVGPFGGLRIEPIGPVSAEVRVGYEVGTIIEARGYEGEEPEAFFVAGRLAWRATPSTTLSLDAARELGFVLGSPLLVQTRVGLAVAQSLPYGLEAIANVAWIEQDPVEDDEAGRSLESIRAGGGLLWAPLSWLVLGLEGTYETTRRDLGGDYDVVRVGLSVTFQP